MGSEMRFVVCFADTRDGSIIGSSFGPVRCLNVQWRARLVPPLRPSVQEQVLREVSKLTPKSPSWQPSVTKLVNTVPEVRVSHSQHPCFSTDPQ